MKRTMIGGLVIGVLGLTGIVLLSRPQVHPPSPPRGKTQPEVSKRQVLTLTPPVMISVPEFSLTSQMGESYGTEQLRGKAWIANFIFTRCQATCPVQTAQLSKLQQELKSHAKWSDIRFVSITVDPDFDTPEVLSDYAEEFQADSEHWKFLSGPREAIWQLSTDGFKLPLEEDAGDAQMAIAHSQKFVLLDHQGDIRGFYDGTSSTAISQLKRDLNRVLDEYMPVPADILAPSWLKTRQQEQLARASELSVYHDFSFSDALGASGITFRNRCVDDSARTWKPAHYDHGNGIAVADVDGDNLIDVYFVTQIGGNELWRNLGNGRFENITKAAGVAVADRVGVTASFVDIDNDGDPDLYVTNVRRGNVLFENDGTGKFSDISHQSGLDYDGHSSSAVFFDYNRDGRVDLFLVNVGIYTTDAVTTNINDRVTSRDNKEYSFYGANPDAFAAHLKPDRAEQSILYENQGGNRFVDVSQKVDLMDNSWSGDASPLDANEDGWPDLYVINMQGNDEYYENVEGERFVKKSRELFPVTPWGTMGIKVFDFDNDGRMDIYLTDMHTDMAEELSPEQDKQKMNPDLFEPSLLNTDGVQVWGNAFFRNEGKGVYSEISEELGAENYWPWGLGTGDVNADGFEDVFITACMNYPFRYGINSLLLNNAGNGFWDSEYILGVEPRRGGKTAAPWFELEPRGRDRQHDISDWLRTQGKQVDRVVVWGALGSRSAAIFDLDNDGDLDIVTNDFNSPPTVLVSNLAERNESLHFLKIKLVGSKSNRDGLGARVRVRAGSHDYTKVHDGKSGYLSQSQLPLYFGLGEAESVEEIEVHWPLGKKQVVTGPLPTNTLLEIAEP